MGTRGFVGFHIGGDLKIAYNHYDSYPAGKGLEVLHWAKKVMENNQWALVGEAAKSLCMITDEDSSPPQEIIELLGAKYGDPTVGAQGMANTVITTWYQLLRNTQGDLDAILDCGYMIDSREFPLDGLFCEWGYLINMEGDGAFEVYRGFAKADHDDGLFGMTGLHRPAGWKPDTAGYGGGSSYYPARRVASWPLFDLPSDEDFLAVDTEED